IATSVPWGMRFPALDPDHGFGTGWWRVSVDFGAQQPILDTLGNAIPVHPTPIYESFGAILIFFYVWRLGSRSLRGPRPIGEVTAEYLLWSGVARFLVEFIRINQRVAFGMSAAQIMALLSAIGGLALLVLLKKRFKSARQEHRIVQHAAEK